MTTLTKIGTKRTSTRQVHVDQVHAGDVENGGRKIGWRFYRSPRAKGGFCQLSGYPTRAAAVTALVSGDGR
jgi:hypothetical protein